MFATDLFPLLVSGQLNENIILSDPFAITIIQKSPLVAAANNVFALLFTFASSLLASVAQLDCKRSDGTHEGNHIGARSRV